MFGHLTTLFLLLTPVLFGQTPAIRLHGILNAASYAAPGLPNGSIAQGSLFSIFGSGLGPAQGVAATSYPVGTALSGVSITLTQGSTTVNVLPAFVSQGQINALMPSNAPLGWGSLRVTYNNARSNFSPVFIVHDSPGIFTFTGTGLGPAALQNYVDAANTPVNGLRSPARRGQVEILYLTGLGPISAADNQPPPAGDLPTPVEVWVGGVPAQVTYAGRSPCCSGLDQVAFVVPNNAPQGCWVPVWIRTNRRTLSNFVSMAIDPGGSGCSDPLNRFSSTVAGGGTMGVLTLNRMSIKEDIGVNQPIEITDDFLTFTATRQTGGAFVFVPLLSLPPAGTCTVYQGDGDFFEKGAIPQTSNVANTLDTGSKVQIAGPQGPRDVPLIGSGGPIGSFMPLWGLQNTLFLGPGQYTVTGAGGAGVGAFQASVMVPPALTWANRDQITNVDRTRPLTLTWSGGAANQWITILGVDSDLPNNASALFVCIAPAGSNSFTVGPEVLGAIPASQPSALRSKAAIFVIGTSEAPFTASGLQTASASSVYVVGKTVNFQ